MSHHPDDGFLWVESDWIAKEFGRLEFVRSLKYHTFKAALNLLYQRGGKTIVETGTMRLKDDPGGCGTLLFGAYCHRYGAELCTVDNDPAHMAVSVRETLEYGQHIRYVTSDSVDFLRGFAGSIDLLYLDSLDCSPAGDSTEAQMHQLHEFWAAEHALAPDAILLCDDSRFPSGGKTLLLKRHLLGRPSEWELILELGQMLWQRKPQIDGGMGH